MRKEQMTVRTQKEIAACIYEMTLEGELAQEVNRPGQFLHIKTSDHTVPLLRRPISICDVHKEAGRLSIIYRAEGDGTKLLRAKKIGDTVDVLGPLGNGFTIDEVKPNDRVLLVGGGVGVPPLYGLAKELKKKGAVVSSVLGFSQSAEVFYDDTFAEAGDVYVSTMDGSKGRKGLVTDVIEQEALSFDWLFACGPKPMLKALEENYPNAQGSLSLEERMGCGIGACFACVCHVQNDPEGSSYRKVCSDGPVFPWREVVL